MTKFNEIQKCIKEYYDNSLLSGIPLIGIIDVFKNGPLPLDLLNSKTCSGLSHEEIRRHGQLVGTRYIIRESEELTAELPTNDLLASGS